MTSDSVKRLILSHPCSWAFNCFFVLLASDIGNMDAYGYCRIDGRIKDMIIRGGENIYPAEIEQFLHTHPKVKEAQVSSNSKGWAVNLEGVIGKQQGRLIVLSYLLEILSVNFRSAQVSFILTSDWRTLRLLQQKWNFTEHCCFHTSEKVLLKLCYKSVAWYCVSEFLNFY